MLLRYKYRSVQLKFPKAYLFSLSFLETKSDFFIATCASLFSAFEGEIVFVPHQTPRHSEASRSEVGKRLEGDTAGAAASTDSTDIPFHTMPCLAIKSQGNGWGVGMFMMAFVFPGNHYMCLIGEGEMIRAGGLL